MTPIEMVLALSLGCLAVALVITSVKLHRHEQYFNQIESIIGMITMRIYNAEVAEKAKENANG